MPQDVWLRYEGKARKCDRCRSFRRDGWKVVTLEGKQFICDRCSPERRSVVPRSPSPDAVRVNVQWEQVLHQFGSCCLMCGATEDLTRDHVLPKVRGGGHGPNNLQPLCARCNNAKSELHIDFRVKPPMWRDEGSVREWTPEHTRHLLAGCRPERLRQIGYKEIPE